MKIFLTVGSMLPFDRLTRAMEAWAQAHPDCEVFAQIGNTSFEPQAMQWQAMISPDQYRQQFQSCDLVVSHVGMGTVITAFECGKPLLMLARRQELQEVTSTHQQATAQWLVGRPGIAVIDSEAELAAGIERCVGATAVSRIETGTQQQLISALRKFIEV